ncbi:hypothetical protein [Reyranella sp.]|uniref:hypothetical protein n=1 Tax=Reyranella sp. TaxID=1929291 RepID=UPI003BAD271E
MPRDDTGLPEIDEVELREVDGHLAEIDAQIAAQRMLVQQLRMDGQPVTESEQVLLGLLESYDVALRRRRLVRVDLQFDPTGPR